MFASPNRRFTGIAAHWTPGLSRLCLTVVVAGIVLTGQAHAHAAPPGEVLIERTSLQNDPFTVVERFPCLGAPGHHDDLAEISGLQTSQFTLTAAGVDENGEPIPPFHLRANVHWKATVDPIAEGLPEYTGSAMRIFHQSIDRLGERIILRQLFKGTAEDGSDRFTFRFDLQVSIDSEGTLRFVHSRDTSCSNE